MDLYLHLGAHRTGTTVIQHTLGRNLLRCELYADAARRLAAYGDLISMAPQRIGLGIRSYASLWESVYAYAMRARALPEFATLKPGLLAQPRGWRDLAADIRATFPKAEIMVWPLEAMQGKVPELAAFRAGENGVLMFGDPEAGR